MERAPDQTAEIVGYVDTTTIFLVLAINMTLRMAISLALLVLLLAGCSKSAHDPYDPSIGPRNPRPGAERYLSGRSDISEAQKKALLDFQPCPTAILEKLADAPSREIRSLVAANPSVNESILEKLVTDPEPGVRQYIASNPNVPRSILLKLRDDPDANVKWSLQHNPEWAREGATKK